MPLESVFKPLAERAALISELLAILLLAFGSLEAIWGLARRPSLLGDLRVMKGVWLRFATRSRNVLPA